MTFLFGGLTGIILASPPLDFHLSDTYFVVAHFHYMVFGTVVFAMFAGLLLLVAEDDGQACSTSGWAKWHFWLLFIGFHMTFLVQHWLGIEGMPRRYVDYLPSDGFTTLNVVSSVGALILGISTLPVPLQRLEDPRARRAWSASTTRGAGAGRWSGRPPARRRGTTSRRIPRIRSESPAFDLHHPEWSDHPNVPVGAGAAAAVSGGAHTTDVEHGTEG